jgi:hypothetical protein
MAVPGCESTSSMRFGVSTVLEYGVKRIEWPLRRCLDGFRIVNRWAAKKENEP